MFRFALGMLLAPLLAAADGWPHRIALGSCQHQARPLPILHTVVDQEPDLFLYLGDNLYGDTRDMQVLQQKYDTLARHPAFRALRAACPILAVWDDHDYGADDAGKEYPAKEASKRIFQDFWKVAPDRASRQRPGIYDVYRFHEAGRTLQIIQLDTRSFRDPLTRLPAKVPPESGWKNAYRPEPDPGRTLLGDAQWRWLETVLREPADLRIVCSSIQFGHEYNGWESWTNLPAERKKLIDLITAARANGVVFLSGDVHWGELSRRDELPGGYPLYDLTASGLNREWHTVEPNRHRVGEAVREHHFGLLEVDPTEKDPVLVLRLIDVEGTERLVHRVPLNRLRFSP